MLQSGVDRIGIADVCHDAQRTDFSGSGGTRFRFDFPNGHCRPKGSQSRCNAATNARACAGDDRNPTVQQDLGGIDGHAGLHR